jgi:hypothetical protein
VGIGVMIVVAVIGMVIKAMIHRSMLTSLDRLLGGAGAVRGVLIAAILVLLAGFTPLTAEPSWKRRRPPGAEPGRGLDERQAAALAGACRSAAQGLADRHAVPICMMELGRSQRRVGQAGRGRR